MYAVVSGAVVFELGVGLGELCTDEQEEGDN